tara:strand:+ start:7328 stop:7510 length:183 start_codon:yes stop_codon:yes gene_type:complete
MCKKDTKICDEINIKYLNTLNNYKLLYEKKCFTNSCKRRKEEIIGNLENFKIFLKDCKEN